ncbi:hypothetical protein SAMN04488033_10790 [Salegentibacter agarivorans]|uniref:Uncharacterized protein n=1 Tax=Salegentibacter agarivorans TaxID=345907 RepID=A0A1I2L524_9FLAO|nr:MULTISPECIES: hypothetical protein [Salegentibacter]SFF74444.1 hypothetical protein SAMN04488033_10790 [Salegentibacter agarivorans]
MSLEGKEIDYIFLGSSRVDNTIDAEIIEDITGKKALNLGIQATEPNDFYLLLKLIDELNIKTEKIFIQIDYSFDLGGKSKILNSYLMPYTQNAHISNHLEETTDDYWWVINFPFYKYLKYDYKIGFREVFSSGIQKPSKTDFANGYFPKYGYSGVPLKGKLSKSIGNLNTYVNAINNFSNKKNINVIYFTAPFCPKTKNLDYISKLKRKLPTLWNFSRLFSTEDYFYDCNHLNNKGAQLFSAKVGAKIKSIESAKVD